MALSKHTLELGEVQETLLIPLWARAAESKRSQPILHDAKAVEVCDRIDFDFSKFKNAYSSRVGICLRTLQFDDWVREFLREHPEGTVVEVGTGLNSRFERVDNGSINWFDLDLPDVISLRRNFFDETERRKIIAASVLDFEWLDTIADSPGPYYVNIEAVLMYLQDAEVRELFRQIHSRLPGAALAFDSLTSRGIERQEKHDTKRHFDARFTWGIEDARSIESWDEGFHCHDHVNLKQVAIRNLDRIPPMLKLISLAMSLFRRADVNSYWLSRFQLGNPSA
ncbi:class I SAM-dependent methyltransferase [Calycomorphotria hydatis]|nr:class I SAM-dependent methyltransferase [Calycomorphotria hydatis]